jgi:hypothetical protein
MSGIPDSYYLTTTATHIRHIHKYARILQYSNNTYYYKSEILKGKIIHTMILNMPDDGWDYECIDFTREPLIIYKAKQILNHDLINYNLPTHTILNILNDDNSIKHIFDFVGTKPNMVSSLSDGEI